MWFNRCGARSLRRATLGLLRGRCGSLLLASYAVVAARYSAINSATSYAIYTATFCATYSSIA